MASTKLQGGQSRDMQGATGSADGKSGVVPAPSAGDEAKILRGDGTWAAMSGGVFDLEVANWSSSTEFPVRVVDMNDVLRLQGPFFGYGAVDGKLRAHGLAEAAVDAPSLVLDPGRVVSLFVELIGLFQYVVWAELDAVLTALAAVADDIHLADDDFVLLRIQGHTPEVHHCSLGSSSRSLYQQGYGGSIRL